MSSGVRIPAIPIITGLARTPDLKWVNCWVIYCAGIPARRGLTGMTLLPSGPWQAAQMLVTIVCALARSGAAGAAGAAAGAAALFAAGAVWARTVTTGHAVRTAAASSIVRFIRELLDNSGAEHPASPRSSSARHRSDMQNPYI